MFVRCVWVPLLRLVCETQEDCLCDLVRSEFSAFPSRKSMCTTTHTHLSKRHAKIVSNAVRRKLCAEFQYFSPYFPQQTKNNSQFFDEGGMVALRMNCNFHIHQRQLNRRKCLFTASKLYTWARLLKMHKNIQTYTSQAHTLGNFDAGARINYISTGM